MYIVEVAKNSHVYDLYLTCHPVNHCKVFKEAIKAGLAYKENSTDIMDEIMKELEVYIRGRCGCEYKEGVVACSKEVWLQVTGRCGCV